jgi:hypothetical protein
VLQNANKGISNYDTMYQVGAASRSNVQNLIDYDSLL